MTTRHPRWAVRLMAAAVIASLLWWAITTLVE